jgi:hypothetical protein
MPGQIGNSGGKKGRSGRRPRSVEQDLSRLLEECVSPEKWRSILSKLGDDAESPSFRIRNESRKVLMAYQFGKPIERHEVEGDVNLNLADPNELKKKFAARRKAVGLLDE